MKLLLDTHVFLWYINGDTKLPPVARDAIRSQTNAVFLSVVSLWEAIVRHQIGKLSLSHPPKTYLPVQRERHLISNLDLNEVPSMNPRFTRGELVDSLMRFSSRCLSPSIRSTRR